MERVLKDEKLEKERQERENEQHGKQESRKRLESLKQGERDELSETPTHVNLFEKEERAMVEQVATGTVTEKKKNSGIMPVVLGETELKNRGDKRPFYLKVEQKMAETNPKDKIQKTRMDPMHMFVRRGAEEEKQEESADRESRRKRQHRAGESDEGSATEKRRRKFHKRKRRHKEKRDRDRDRDREEKRCKFSRDKQRKGNRVESSPTIEELRRRRRDREERESQREGEIILRQTQKIVTNRYQDQYNPGLSRR